MWRVEPLPGRGWGCWGVGASPSGTGGEKGDGGNRWVGLARQGQINKEGPGGGRAWEWLWLEAAEMKVAGPAAGRWPPPALSALFNVPVRVCGRWVREARAHLSQALEGGLGRQEGRNVAKGVTERKRLAHALSVPRKHRLSLVCPGRQA